MEDKKKEAEKDGGDYEVAEEDLLTKPNEPSEVSEPNRLHHAKASHYTMESVGRVYIELEKMTAPSRWKRLYNKEF